MNVEGEEAINAICPYFTMFPLSFPHRILRRHAEPNHVVCDPFCGRGTTIFAARLLGLKAIGIDTHPLAAALTEAKLVRTTPDAVGEAFCDVLAEVTRTPTLPKGDFWELAFRPQVLNTLCRLRKGLLVDCASPARKVLRAIILGALHGPKTVRVSRSAYFSNQCPRTYSPKPDYAARFWRRHRARPRLVDIEEIVRTRAERYCTDMAEPGFGRGILGDSRQASALSAFRGSLDWIITSPPYYGMRTYGPDQWLRLWFLGGKSRPDYTGPDQLTHQSVEAFAQDLSDVWSNLARRARPTCKLVVRFGAINDRDVDPIDTLRLSFMSTGWRITNIYQAGEPKRGRRQAEHFGTTSRMLPEFDVWARRA